MHTAQAHTYVHKCTYACNIFKCLVENFFCLIHNHDYLISTSE